MGAQALGELNGRLKLKQDIPLGGSLEREAINKKEAGEWSDAETTDFFNDGVVKSVSSYRRSRGIGIKKRFINLSLRK